MEFLPFTFETPYYHDDLGPELKFVNITFTQDCERIAKGTHFDYGIFNLTSGNLYLYEDRNSTDETNMCVANFKPLTIDHTF